MILHHYQERARDFLRSTPRAGLFLDMGYYSGMGRPRSLPDPVPRVCIGCDAAFTPDRYNQGQKFCTHRCFLRFVNADPARQSEKGKKGAVVTSAQKRERAEAEGYRGYVKAPGQRRHAHRVVAEQVLGRALLPGEVVHHEDQNKTNNGPENLVVFPSQKEHAKHHKLGHCGIPRCSCYCIRLKEVTPDVQ
jgi:hypothetical protein